MSRPSAPSPLDAPFAKAWLRAALLAAFAFATFFANNTALRPDLMEARNLATAHEMVADGHWLVPTMNGDYRLEKPPLPTWTAACVEALFGDSLAMQRSMAGLMGLLLALFLYLLASALAHDRTTGLVSALLLMTCYSVVAQGRTATWDIYCHAFMLGAVYFLYRGLYEERRAAPRLLLAGLFMGLSFLSKGPVAFAAMLLPAALALLAWRRPAMRGRWLPLAGAAALACALGLSWYLCLWCRVPEVLASVAHKETSAWTGHNVRSPFYYWRFFLETGIWAPLLLVALYRTLRHGRAERAATRIGLVWLLAALAVLSLFPEKKMRYLMPVMAPCCLLMAGWACHHLPRGRLLRAVAAVCALFALAECAALPFLPRLLYANRRGSDALRPVVHRAPFPEVCFVDEGLHLLRMNTVYSLRSKVEALPAEEVPARLLAARRPILFLFPGDTDLAALPLPEGASAEDLGLFNDNAHAESNKHYRPALVNRALLYTPPPRAPEAAAAPPAPAAP